MHTIACGIDDWALWDSNATDPWWGYQGDMVWYYPMGNYVG